MDEKIWMQLDNSFSINYRLDPFEYNEEIDQLKEQLRVEFWKMVEACCTDHQKEILKLIAEGKTQQEIAKILDVNQSSVTKSLNGNCDYNKGKRVYGGAIKKLRKEADNNENIKVILARLNEIIEEKL